MFLAVPIFPVCTAIYTDPRGTNARIRGNKRYGKYWPAKESFKYYEIHDYDKILEKISDRDVPLGIENVASPIGWDKPIDSQGNWLKNPKLSDKPIGTSSPAWPDTDGMFETDPPETHH